MFFRIFGMDGKRDGEGLPREVDTEQVADALARDPQFADALARDPQFAERVANLVSQRCFDRFAQAMSKTLATWQNRTSAFSHGVDHSISHTTTEGHS